MKLTKKQRREIYKLAYERIESQKSDCICMAILTSSNLWFSEIGGLKEFNLINPKNREKYWYGDSNTYINEEHRDNRLTALAFMMVI